MGSEFLQSVIRRLRALAEADHRGTDGQLLRRFADTRDPAAFEALLAKYGPLVFGVCRRVLGEGHDAEDAFQATFLVLARRAGAIDGGGTVAGWLYTVAYHLASRVRADASRRRQREARAAVPSTAESRHEVDSDLRRVIDEEVNRLPANYRLPVVLCYLEGRTQEEAASLLGWTKGTVSGRLARAKEALRGRLARRGVGTVEEELPRPAAPPDLMQGTLGASVAFAGGPGGGTAVGLATAFLQRGGVAKAVSLTAAGLALAAGTCVVIALASAPPLAPPVERPRKARVDRLGDPLPPDALARLGTVRLAHGRGVRCAAFSPDGKLLAASDRVTNNEGDSIRLWDTATGEERGRLPGVASHLAFAPDGRRLAASNEFSVLSLWDVTTAQLVWRWDASREKDASKFAGVAFAPDGQTVALAVADRTVRLHSADTGREVRRAEVKATAVAFSPDGKTLAAADGWGKTVTLVDPATGRTRHTLKHEVSVHGIAFSPDSALLVVSGDGNQVVLWDVTTGKETRRVNAPGIGVPIRFTADGRGVRTGQWTFDLATGTETRPPLTGSGLATSSDGRMWASVGYGPIRLWDTAAEREVVALDRHDGALRYVIPSADGKRITTLGMYDGEVRVWEAATGKPLALRRSTPWQRFAALSADGKVLATPHYNKEYALVELATLQMIEGGGPNGHIGAMALSADAGFLAVASGEKQVVVRLWDAPRGRLRHTLKAREGGYGSLAFSPDGERLAAAASLEAIDVWDVDTGKPLTPPWQPAKRANPYDQSIRPAEVGDRWTATHDPHAKPSPTAALLFSPARDAVAVASGFHYVRWQGMPLPDAGLVRVYDARTGKERFQLSMQGAAVAFSPDGKWLATGGHGDDAVYVWDALTGKRLRRFAGHGGAITALTFTADGRRLISGSADGTALVWDVAGSP